MSESVRECQAILMRFPIQLKQMPSKPPAEPKTLKIKSKKKAGEGRGMKRERQGMGMGKGNWWIAKRELGG